MVPRATMIIREATVFIGIWTAADSDMVSGFLLINYFDHNHSTSLFHGQQMILQTFLKNFLIIFLLLNFVKEVVRVFGSPFTRVFNIPFRSLDLPIRDISLTVKEGMSQIKLTMNMGTTGVTYMGNYYGVFKCKHTSNLCSNKERIFI